MKLLRISSIDLELSKPPRKGPPRKDLRMLKVDEDEVAEPLKTDPDLNYMEEQEVENRSR